MKEWLVPLLVCLLIPMDGGVEYLARSDSKTMKAQASVSLSRDEKANTQYRTEIPVPEIQKWGSRSMRCHFVVINDTHVGPSEMRGLDVAMLRLKDQNPDFIAFTDDLTRGQGESESTKRDSFKT